MNKVSKSHGLLPSNQKNGLNRHRGDYIRANLPKIKSYAFLYTLKFVSAE